MIRRGSGTGGPDCVRVAQQPHVVEYVLVSWCLPCLGGNWLASCRFITLPRVGIVAVVPLSCSYFGCLLLMSTSGRLGKLAPKMATIYCAVRAVVMRDVSIFPICASCDRLYLLCTTTISIGSRRIPHSSQLVFTLLLLLFSQTTLGD